MKDIQRKPNDMQNPQISVGTVHFQISKSFDLCTKQSVPETKNRKFHHKTWKKHHNILYYMLYYIIYIYIKWEEKLVMNYSGDDYFWGKIALNNWLASLLSSILSHFLMTRFSQWISVFGDEQWFFKVTSTIKEYSPLNNYKKNQIISQEFCSKNRIEKRVLGCFTLHS